MEEWISELEDRMLGIEAEEQNKEQRMKRIEDSLETSRITLSIPIFKLQGSQKKKRKTTSMIKYLKRLLLKNPRRSMLRNELIKLTKINHTHKKYLKQQGKSNK